MAASSRVFKRSMLATMAGPRSSRSRRPYQSHRRRGGASRLLRMGGRTVPLSASQSDHSLKHRNSWASAVLADCARRSRISAAVA